MDVRMPGTTGVEATRRIVREWPGPGPVPRVLVLTTFGLDEYVHAPLRAGAVGFLLKNGRPDSPRPCARRPPASPPSPRRSPGASSTP